MPGEKAYRGIPGRVIYGAGTWTEQPSQTLVSRSFVRIQAPRSLDWPRDLNCSNWRVRDRAGNKRWLFIE